MAGWGQASDGVRPGGRHLHPPHPDRIGQDQRPAKSWSEAVVSGCKALANTKVHVPSGNSSAASQEAERSYDPATPLPGTQSTERKLLSVHTKPTSLAGLFCSTQNELRWPSTDKGYMMEFNRPTNSSQLCFTRQRAGASNVLGKRSSRPGSPHTV